MGEFSDPRCTPHQQPILQIVSNDFSIYTPFWIFSKNSFRNKLHVRPLYPILIPNTPNVIFYFILFVFGSLGVTKIYQKFIVILDISIRVCKKIFCTKIIIIFVLGVPKSALRGGKTKMLDFFIGASATKRSEKSRIFRYWLPEDFAPPPKKKC